MSSHSLIVRPECSGEYGSAPSGTSLHFLIEEVQVLKDRVLNSTKKIVKTVCSNELLKREGHKQSCIITDTIITNTIIIDTLGV